MKITKFRINVGKLYFAVSELSKVGLIYLIYPFGAGIAPIHPLQRV